MNSRGLQFIKGFATNTRFRTSVFTSFNSQGRKNYHNYGNYSANNGIKFGVGSLAFASLGTIASYFTKEKNSTFVVSADEKKREEKEEKQVVLFRPQIQTLAERIIMWALAVFTFGIGYFIIYPLLEYEYYKRSISEVKIKKHRLQFKADVTDFYWEKVTIFCKNVVTLGFYSLLGYGQERWATFIDENIKVHKD